MAEDVAKIARGLTMPVGNSISRNNEQFPLRAFDDRRCHKNHSQSARRLSERGGLSWCEAAAILEDREWCEMDEAEAEAAVRAHLEQQS
jgi:hypothetical protein